MTAIMLAAVLLLAGAALAARGLMAVRSIPSRRDDVEGWRRGLHTAYGRSLPAAAPCVAGLLLIGWWPVALVVGLLAAVNGLLWLALHALALHARDRPGGGG